MTGRYPSLLSSWFVLLIFQYACFGEVASDEEMRDLPTTRQERVDEHHRRGHIWPVSDFVPNTPGWTHIMRRRLDQVMAMEDMNQKWNGYYSTLGPALCMPNFTEYGFGLTRAPEALTDEVRKFVYGRLPTARPESGKVVAVDGPHPMFISSREVKGKISAQLQPILEAWSGIELEASSAYGFRLYRNESRLYMHTDKSQTHVISCIYHIGSSEDSEPWPIVVEDFNGNTNTVILTPGDVLLYESAKNFHGRPTKFNGSWYTSMFVHFYPKDPAWAAHDHDLDAHYAIPLQWKDVRPSNLPSLRVVGSNFLEPDCADFWCNLQTAVELEGPGERGQVMTVDGTKYPLHVQGGANEAEL